MKKKNAILLFPLFLVILAAIILLVNSCKTSPQVMTGVIETTVVNVSSEIPGRVDSIFVNRGDLVEKGQILATIQPNIMNAKLGQAAGVLQAANALVQKAENGAREQQKRAAKNQYEMAESQYVFARKTYHRFKVLFADSIIAKQEMDEIEFKYKAAKNQMEEAKAIYDMALEGARKEDIVAAKGEYIEAKNVYNEAQAYHNELEIVAPVSGEISNKIAQPGEVMGAGYPLLSIQIPKDAYLLLNVREDKLASFQKGKKCKVKVPALNGKEFIFMVNFLAPMADFATWVPTKAKGEYDLKTFEVHLKPAKQITGLRPGMTAQVYY
ncbi:MAG: efflux RND transporter periplasmic adaptor subunit [Candidatus Cloacimonadota bacterium]|nr:efflux RND transporter periplasmic adaptor subunit [Candidatus Cloacimonadota bacterium]